MALRRFIALRGPVKKIFCDQGTNLVGAANEFESELKAMKQDEVKEFLLKNNCDIQFEFNPPSASHFGGVFERQIQTIRKVLAGILLEQGHCLSSESLSTFLLEACAIVNSRPLSVVNIQDQTLEPLTPNHLLSQKSRVIVSPPGNFVRQDLYLVKHWRRVQHLANVFWKRWRSEYLSQINRRPKWTDSSENISHNDIVLIVDENLPRSSWRLARVIETYASKDNLVRSVRLKVATKQQDNKGHWNITTSFLVRPISKLILLLKG